MADKKNIPLAIMTASLILLSNGVEGEEAIAEIQQEELSYSDVGPAEEVLSNFVCQTEHSKGASEPKGNLSGSKKTAEGSNGSNTGTTGTKNFGQAEGTTQPNGAKKPAEGQCSEGKCGSGRKKPSEREGATGTQSNGGGTTSYKKSTSQNSTGK